MKECKNCECCDIITDSEYCKRLKCTATKRGRTITWSMCCINSNVFQYFADYVAKHAAPKWCPKNKKGEDSGREEF